MRPFWVISLIAVVGPKEVVSARLVFPAVASSLSSTGCQSAEYFSSKRCSVVSNGGAVRPVPVMIQPSGVRARFVCSRPMAVPR